VGITGSNGKTTVKEMTAAILGRRGPALVTRGNLNNDIGVPLTLARLGLEHGTAVIEMGANHPGEIAYLTDLARPTVGLVNNAGPAHLEGFGSLTGVARAKGELFQHLPPVPWRSSMPRIASHPCGASWPAIARSSASASRAAPMCGRLAWRRVWQRTGHEHPAGQPVPAAAPAGSPQRHECAGRHRRLPGRRRQPARGARGPGGPAAGAGSPAAYRLADAAVLIDDTYNANPGSLRAGIEVLALGQGPKWLVLGDMAELGPEGERLHRQMGKLARETGVERLFALGDLAAAAAETFGAHGSPVPPWRHWSAPWSGTGARACRCW
jgi:UDP-N-acetylmuramoyl-tripeptide--D-alanyl-D-alanine ligase